MPQILPKKCLTNGPEFQENGTKCSLFCEWVVGHAAGADARVVLGDASLHSGGQRVADVVVAVEDVVGGTGQPGDHRQFLGVCLGRQDDREQHGHADKDHRQNHLEYKTYFRLNEANLTGAGFEPETFRIPDRCSTN